MLGTNIAHFLNENERLVKRYNNKHEGRNCCHVKCRHVKLSSCCQMSFFVISPRPLHSADQLLPDTRGAQARRPATFHDLCACVRVAYSLFLYSLAGFVNSSCPAKSIADLFGKAPIDEHHTCDSLEYSVIAYTPQLSPQTWEQLWWYLFSRTGEVFVPWGGLRALGGLCALGGLRAPGRSSCPGEVFVPWGGFRALGRSSCPGEVFVPWGGLHALAIIAPSLCSIQLVGY